jgi:hypothetical protein
MEVEVVHLAAVSAMLLLSGNENGDAGNLKTLLKNSPFLRI